MSQRAAPGQGEFRDGGWLEPYDKWEKPTNWCRILSIHGNYETPFSLTKAFLPRALLKGGTCVWLHYPNFEKTSEMRTYRSKREPCPNMVFQVLPPICILCFPKTLQNGFVLFFWCPFVSFYVLRAPESHGGSQARKGFSPLEPRPSISKALPLGGSWVLVPGVSRTTELGGGRQGP